MIDESIKATVFGEEKTFARGTTFEDVVKEYNNINISDITQFICYSNFTMFFGMLKRENENDNDTNINQEIMVMVKIENILLYCI